MQYSGHSEVKQNHSYLYINTYIYLVQSPVPKSVYCTFKDFNLKIYKLL